MNPTDLMSPELVKFAFVFGMVLSVFLYERSHLTTGSIVVPGFLGIHVFEPWVIIVSLLNAWICFAFVHIVLPRFTLMNTKSKFYALISTSVLLQLGIAMVSQLPFELAFAGKALHGFGYIIPGLIAHDMYRNGAIKTSIHTLLASYLIGFLVLGCVVLAPNVSLNLQETVPIPMEFSLPLVLVLSTLGAIVLNLKTPVRSGGYVTAAYFVFFGLQPFAIVVISVVALINYVICCQLLMPTMIIFGRRKFALILIVGAMLMWATTLWFASIGIYIPLSNHPAFAGVVVLLPGLITNDIQRTNVSCVLVGLCLLVCWVSVLANLFYEIKHFSRPEYVVPLIGCLGIVLFVLLFLRKHSVAPLHTQTLLIDVP